MKFIQSLILAAAAVVLTHHAHAEGMEEICSRISLQDVKFKNYMNEDSEFIPIYLDTVNKAKVSQKVKEGSRERIFWIYNRRTLSDDSLQKLSFIRCITGNM